MLIAGSAGAWPGPPTRRQPRRSRLMSRPPRSPLKAWLSLVRARVAAIAADDRTPRPGHLVPRRGPGGQRPPRSSRPPYNLPNGSWFVPPESPARLPPVHAPSRAPPEFAAIGPAHATRPGFTVIRNLSCDFRPSSDLLGRSQGIGTIRIIPGCMVITGQGSRADLRLLPVARKRRSRPRCWSRWTAIGFRVPGPRDRSCQTYWVTDGPEGDVVSGHIGGAHLLP